WRALRRVITLYRAGRICRRHLSPAATTTMRRHSAPPGTQTSADVVSIYPSRRTATPRQRQPSRPIFAHNRTLNLILHPRSIVALFRSASKHYFELTSGLAHRADAADAVCCLAGGDFMWGGPRRIVLAISLVAFFSSPRAFAQADVTSAGADVS